MFVALAHRRDGLPLRQRHRAFEHNALASRRPRRDQLAGRPTDRSVWRGNARARDGGDGGCRWPRGVGDLNHLQTTILWIHRCVFTPTTAVCAQNNVVPFAIPARMQLSRSNLSVTAVRTSGGGFAARVATEAVAMYVTLTTLQHGEAQHLSGSGSHEPLRCSERSHRRSSVWAGRFEDNAFLLLPPGRTVGFVPTPRAGAAELLGDEAFGVFAASLRVEDVSTYMHG